MDGNSLTKPESVSTSARHCDTLSPWRIADGMSETIVDALSRVQASAANAETAAYIVEAANNYEVLIQERRRLIGELDAAKAHAENEERWAEAESSRLRKLIRRLAEYIRREGSSEVCITSTDPKQNYHVKSADLLREAREAIGEDKP